MLCLMANTALGQYAVTLAGGRPGVGGNADGNLTVARFNLPKGVAVHSGSGQVYVVDNSNAVRRLTPGVGVATFAGNATAAGAVDAAVGTDARFNRPEGIAVDDGGTVFVADTLNHTIRRITSAGVVTTIAGTAGIAGSFDGPGSSAEFNQPRAVAIGPGGALYVADSGNHVIRKITFVGGVATVTTLAGQPGLPGSKNGTGAGTAAAPQFRNPQGLAVDGAGNVFVADTANNAIRRITPAGVTTVFAGSVTVSGSVDGTGGVARFSQPVGIAINAAGVLHVGDTGSAALRMITTGGRVTTPAGLLGAAGSVNGVGAAARFSGPRGVAVDGAGNLWIADGGNQTVRRAFVPGRLPMITLQPTGATVEAEGKAVFRVRATGPGPILYRWQKNGVDLPEATSNTLTVQPAEALDQGAYQVIVENPWGLVASETVPLVVTGQVSWLWAARLGGADEDAALDLLVQPAAGSSGESLLVAGRNKGHALSRHSVTRGVTFSSAVLDKKGDGLNAVARDASGNVYVGGDTVLVNNGKPGLLVKRSPAGATLWRRELATERGGRFSPGSNADVQGLAVDAAGAVVSVGYFQGSGKFGEVALGRAASTVNHGFVAKHAANGDLMWSRDVFSLHAPDQGKLEGESLVWAVVVGEGGEVYAAGMAGPNARFQKATAAAEETDFEAFANARASTPFVVRYEADGTLAWVRMAAYEGHFFGLRLGLNEEVWVTGFDGDRVDGAQQTAVLEALNTVDGSLIKERRVPGGKGASVDVSAEQGLAWLVLDPAGRLDFGGRRLGVPGYRVISLDEATLAARWDLPVMGALSLAPLALSEQADVRFGAGGLLYAALTFEMPTDPLARVEFAGRAAFPLKGRRTDGFLAAIGERPRVSVPPVHELAALGGAVNLQVETAGFLQPRFQWMKNGQVVPGQTGRRVNLPAVKLADAGAWSVRLTNGLDTITSAVAQLGVVDAAGPGEVPGAVGRSVRLTVEAAGNGLGFQWSRVGQPLPVERASGVTTKALTLRGLLRPDDDGDYVCQVTGPGGTLLMTDPRKLRVKIPPVLNPLILPDGIVSQSRADLISVENDPTQFVIVGLPPGISYNPATGALSGKATRAGTFTVRVTASNVAGSSSTTATWRVAALPPGVVGRFAAAVAPDAALSGSLGGRVELTTTSMGLVSGVLDLRTGREAFTGALDAALNGECALSVSISGGRVLELVFEPMGQTMVGTLGNGLVTTAVSGEGNPWSATTPATVHVGRWNAGLQRPVEAEGQEAVPQGDGFASFTVAPDGLATMAGRLADGTVLTGAGFVTRTGTVLVQRFLDAGVSSVQGWTVLNGTSEVRWLKGPQTPASRAYAAGFGPMNLGATSALHVTPATDQILLGLPNAPGNAQLAMVSGGLAAPLNLGFRLTTTHQVVAPTPNPNMLILTVSPVTGRYSGRYSVTDAGVTRLAVVEGLTVGGQSAGYFLLPKAEPPIATAPLLSGQAVLRAAGP
jgi:sugar lactone lactonase YvrE